MANFEELRDGLRSPVRVAKAKADLLLNRLFPTAWRPLYTMVSHTDLPYGEAVRRARRQDRLLAGAAALSVVGIVVGGAAAAVAHSVGRADR